MLHSVLAAATEWVSPQVDYHALAPEIVLAAGLCVVLLADLFLDESRKWIISSLTGFTLLGAMLPVLTLGLSEVSVRSMFDGRYVVDEFSIVTKAMFLIAGYVVVLLSTKHVEEDEYWRGEYWFLLLTSILGMVMMTSSRDLVSIFVALEFLSIPAYMLAAWRKRDIKSNEAGMKYFLLGVFASAVTLYGMSLLFGAANSTLLVDLGKSITATGGFSALHALGVVFVIVGFAFKVSAVPFHSWAPDTYEGAPSPITAFLSVASKAAGFVALVTLIFVAFPQASDVWQPFIWVLSALTMTVGNVIALRQTNIVRMMAYSSIAQAGFMLFAVFAFNATSWQGLILYSAAYTLASFGVFAVMVKLNDYSYEGFNGLARKEPVLALTATISLLSLAGIPLTGGFFAKYMVLSAAMEQGKMIGLVVFAVLMAAVSAWYYFRVIMSMYFRAGEPVLAEEASATERILLVLNAIAILALGILPGWLI